MYLIASIVIVISFLIAIKVYFRRRFSYWSKQGVAGYPGIPFAEFGQPAHTVHLENANKYGPIYGSFEFTRPVLVVNEPDLIRDIMVKDFHNFYNRRELYFGEDSINLNLFNLPGDDRWRRIRAIMSPAFTSGKLRAMTESMSSIADTVVENLTKSLDANKANQVDVREYIGGFLIDVIASCGYGIKTNALNNPEQPIVIYSKKIFDIESIPTLIIAVTIPKLAKRLKLKPFSVAAIAFFKELTHTIISERSKQTVGDQKRSDFIQLLIDANKNFDPESPTPDSTNKSEPEESEELLHKSKKHLSISPIEMTAQGILFFVAGFDTTGSTIAHALYYLSKHPECQTKLVEELSTLDSVTNESLTELKYLNGVIHETLRLSPPILKISRESARDYKLANTDIVVPAGCIVMFEPYSLHRDPRYFAEPELFIPERFAESKRDVHPYAFLPFGGGQRNCVGMRFALIQVRMCLAKLVLAFQFDLCADTKLEYNKGTAFHTPKEVRLGVHKR